MKFVELREAAKSDTAAAASFYNEEGGLHLAEEFVTALEAAYEQVCQFPNSGSPRYGQLLGVNDLRHCRVGRFPWLALYVPRDDHIEVIRILHASRDIPSWLQGPE